MINIWAYDVEVLPNFFSIVFVNVTDYLKVFDDACDIKVKKGKEIKNPKPLVQCFTVNQIKQKLNTVEKKAFYITDEDDSQLVELLGFINSLMPHRNNEGVAVRTDLYGFNSDKYDKLMVAALLMYFNQTTNTAELIKKLYLTSRHIIDMQNHYELAQHDYQLDTLNKFSLPFINVDIMTIFALNKVGKGTDKEGNTVYFPKSLKQTSINLQWYELLEHDLPPISDVDRHYYKNYQGNNGTYTNEQLNRLIGKWERFVIKDWIAPIMHYNANDVYIVCEMIRLYIDEIRLRYNISNVYEVDVLSSSRSNIADKLFVKFYSNFSNLQPSQWRGKSTIRTIMSLKKIILPFITFKTPKLQAILDDMKVLQLTSLGKDGMNDAIISAFNAGLLKSELKEQAFKVCEINKSTKKGATAKLEGINVKINNLEYTIATGGLHSKDIPRELKSKLVYIDEVIPLEGKKVTVWDNITDNSYIYVHWDIASFYPSIIVVYRIAPAHLNEGIFVKLVKWIKDTRVQAKHSVEDYIDGIPKDVLAQVLKIVINSIYGKFGFEKGDLYDRLATLKVTINGQLMIMMLCEELELNDIEVVSANTDGIVVKLYKNKKEIFDNIAEKWKKLTGLEADSEEYKAYINRDINNYICQELDDKLSFKGALNPKMYLADLTKGYDMPIVAEAVYQYFINNVPVLDTLYKATNILDFCKTQNIAKSFDVEYSIGTTTQLIQRNTRFYVANEGGSLYKVGMGSNGQMMRNNLCSGQKVVVLNTLDDKPIEQRDICYQYYYNEAYKIIDPIKLGISPSQKADPVKKTQSGKRLIDKYKGQYNSLFDDNI